MNIYFLFFLLLIIITMICIKIKGFDYIKKNDKYLILIFILLTLFLALKSENVGVDADSYKKIFYDIAKFPFSKVYLYDRYEIGYKYLCKIFSLIWNNYQFFLFGISFLEMAGFYCFIKKYSKNYVFSLLLFITFETYTLTFGILRQAIALSISLLAFNFLDKRKPIKFILLVLLASLFHKTAAIFLLAYPFLFIKVNKKVIVIFTFIVIFTLLFGNDIVNFIMNYIYRPSTSTFNSGYGYKMIVLLYSICIFIYIHFENLKKTDTSSNVLLLMLMLGNVIQCLAPTYKNTGRLVIYFFPFIDVLIPNTLEIIKNNRIKLILEILMIVSLSIFFFVKTSNLLYETLI